MASEPTIKAVREACGHNSDATNDGMPSLIYRTAVGDAVRRLGAGDAPAPKSPEAVAESALVGRAWADGQSVWMCVFDIAFKRWGRALHENSPAEDNRRVLRRAVKEWMR